MNTILIKNATCINEGIIAERDIFLKNGIIDSIGTNLSPMADHTIEARGMLLLPGAIDDQVHFREPGLTHKGEIQTESRAAVAGGITSYMEMPNTSPQALTQALLQDKYDRAAQVSAANYSFFMGTSNDNLEEVLRTNPENVCGVKIFMGSSTGNMLVDNADVLEKLFAQVPILIATHCESEAMIRANMAAAVAQFGEDIPITQHPIIRDAAACYASSSFAVALAQKHNTRLHVLHISSAEETLLFEPLLDGDFTKKRITAEACIHHLWFSEEDYAKKGTFIKWNPAVKSATDREAIRQAVREGRIDVIATDHAPHTIAEKEQRYAAAPSGGPLVQHALPAMLELAAQGVFSYELVVEKMCHAPARLFQIRKRGYIREGYFADLVLVEKKPWQVTRENLLYKCGWSPLEGQTFQHNIHTTFLNGEIAYQQGKLHDVRGQRLLFDRD